MYMKKSKSTSNLTNVCKSKLKKEKTIQQTQIKEQLTQINNANDHSKYIKDGKIILII